MIFLGVTSELFNDRGRRHDSISVVDACSVCSSLCSVFLMALI